MSHFDQYLNFSTTLSAVTTNHQHPSSHQLKTSVPDEPLIKLIGQDLK